MEKANYLSETNYYVRAEMYSMETITEVKKMATKMGVPVVRIGVAFKGKDQYCPVIIFKTASSVKAKNLEKKIREFFKDANLDRFVDSYKNVI